ncbi:MAG: phosphatase PAP2 family protein [Hyphomicrobiales bacterium]|nr:phosphatase PAP2 family protein [Hyphomicrobiales bacterium]
MTGMALAAAVAVLIAHFFDDSATLFVRASYSPFLAAMAEITDVGKSQWYLVTAALMFIGIAGLDWETRNGSGRSRLAFLFAQAGYVFLGVGFARIIVSIVKVLVGRARPILFDEGGSLHFQPFTATDVFNSFPSGHSATMGAVAMALMLWFPRARIPIFLICAFAAATRVAARAHYPSDVVAGYAVGLLSALFVARWLARRRVAFRFRNNESLPVPRFRVWGRKNSRNG